MNITWGKLKKYFFNIKKIDFKYIKKENSNFMKFLNFFLKLFKINNSFMENYTTVISEKIYYPSWFFAPKKSISIYNEEKIDLTTFITIVHESIHVLQERREGSKLKYWMKYLLSKNNRYKYEEEAYITNIFLTGYILLLSGKDIRIVQLSLENISDNIRNSMISGYRIGEDNGKIAYKNFITISEKLIKFGKKEISEDELYSFVRAKYSEDLSSSLELVVTSILS